jgi:topoisomerase-4 subunit A
VMGWKALGNRLSEYKVTKVNLVQDEETGLEEGDDENENVDSSKVTESDDSQSPKKKLETGPNQWLDEGEQAQLFAAPEKPKHQLPPKAEPKLKVKAEQQNLFGAGQSQSEKKDSEEKKIVEEPEKKPRPEPKPKEGGKSFDVGDTIEFDI